MNNDVKGMIAYAGLKQWQVAVMLGISEARFSTMLRSELKPDVKEKIRQICEEAKRTEAEP